MHGVRWLEEQNKQSLSQLSPPTNCPQMDLGEAQEALAAREAELEDARVCVGGRGH